MPKSVSGTEFINHFNGVIIRITGDCELDITFEGLPSDDGTVDTLDLVPLDVTVTTRRPLVALANFVQQRACVEFSVDQINEYFDIKSIRIPTRPVATGYPQL